jgi:glycosyltransferase involved in cell wall biosynthesis
VSTAQPIISPDDIRVLIVTENASFKFGGEAILPAHYFQGLRRRGIECWLITHTRTRPELEAAFPDDQSRISYLADTWLQKLLFRLSKPFSDRLTYFTFEWAIRILTQRRARNLAKELVRKHAINIVHQPNPVSPKEPTLLRNLGAPLIVGPMNGGMVYPRAFRHYDSLPVRMFERAATFLFPLTDLFLPGKREARLLLVANARTRAALPRTNGNVLTVVENGVDLELWEPKPYPDDAHAHEPVTPARPIAFLFAGRLVTMKGVDLLIEAVALACEKIDLRLDIVGDGRLRQQLQARVEELKCSAVIKFLGWLSQPDLARRMAASDVFVFPSLRDCGGAVVLEAMASGLPTIAVNWGGPADYLDPTTGILLDPVPREQLVRNLADAMLELAANPQRRRALGQAARQKVETEYAWHQKIDHMIGIYQSVLAAPSTTKAHS